MGRGWRGRIAAPALAVILCGHLLQAGPMAFAARQEASAGGCVPWQVVPKPGPEYGYLTGIDGVSSGDFWVVGSTWGYPTPPIIYHWNAGVWEKPPVSVVGGLDGVEVLSATDAWAVGTRGNIEKTLAMHWDGLSWSMVHAPSPGPGDYDVLTDVSGTGPADIWAVGRFDYAYGLIEHWDGARWSVAPHHTFRNGETFWGVLALAPDDAWAVGERHAPIIGKPIIEHWDGTGWRNVNIPGKRAYGVLQSVGGSGPDDVYAVGRSYGSEGPLIYHWDGAEWRINRDALPRAGWPVAVAALSPEDAWIAGGAGDFQSPIAAHWNGQAWADTPAPDEASFGALKAFSPDDVWGAGGGVELTVERYMPCT